MSYPSKKSLAGVGVILAAMAVGDLVPSTARAAAHRLVVPTAYRTIQSAVDAARPGSVIKVRSGIYREQVSVDKDLRVIGSGAGSTTIKAPATLVGGEDGGNSIVEIHAGASVSMSRITVSGPGAGTCEDGPLGSGIRVIGGGHLNLSFARVTHIQDTPIAPCFRSATAILIGDVPSGTGSATIRNSQITHYQGAGVVALGAGTAATVFGNVVTGQDRLSTDGIEFVFGAVGNVSHNVVSENACRAPDPGCGPDPFNDVQHAGILAGGTGTVVSHNLLYGNQVGVYAFETARIDHNVLLDNDLFGAELQDGSFALSDERIAGGVSGVAVVAASADTEAVLDRVRIARTSGAPVQKLECCGFTATATRKPLLLPITIHAAR